MQVMHILKSKSDDSVTTISPEARLDEAAKILSERGIGTVIVSSDGTSAEGILSERDIVRVLGKSGAGSLGG